MKKLLKENFKILIIVLITTVVASVTTIFAYSLVAGDVGYTPHDTTWNVENVEAALNNLNLRENQLDTNFSTDEQVVGRWIDGKKIYQKTITGSGSTTNSSVYYVGKTSEIFPNIETVVNSSITGTDVHGYGYQSNQYYFVGIGTGSSDELVVAQRFGSASHSFNYRVTVQYTKTTD